MRAGKGFAVRGTGIDKHGGVNITWRSEYIYIHIIYYIFMHWWVNRPTFALLCCVKIKIKTVLGDSCLVLPKVCLVGRN